MALARKDILCISSIDWDFIWQGHQEIMATLAAAGNRVLFVENTGVRRPRLSDLPRLRHRLRNWWRGVMGFRQERERLYVYSPLVLPFPYSRLARWVNRRVLVRGLQRWMRATGFARPIVWTFLPTPLVTDVLRELEPELVIYYCIDDLSASSPQARRIGRSEEQLLRQADLVFVTSAALRERVARFTDRVHLFPFGVKYQAFEEVRVADDGIPRELQALPRPVAGYVGGVHRWVDQDLLATVAESLPDVSFVLVGPEQTDVSTLRRPPNVHFIGARPHPDVPRFIKGFDVALVPYRVSDYTASVYPTKLNEYLAMGVPVVATDIPEIRRFNRDHGDVVAVAGDADAFRHAVRASIDDKSADAEARRIAIAKANSWEARIAAMGWLVEAALAQKRTAARTWEDSLRGLYRRTRRRLVRTVVIAAAVYLAIFETPLLWMVGAPLRVAEPPRAADAIVVFAGGVGESGKAGGGYQERVKEAIDLYRRGHAPAVIFSSGYVYALKEADVMRDLAIANGIPASAILLERNAANTYQNVLFVRRMLDERGWRRVLLVSSPYHMRRAVLTARTVAPEIAVVAVPASSSQFYAHHRGATLDQVRGILHEYAAIAAYWWRGWI